MSSIHSDTSVVLNGNNNDISFYFFFCANTYRYYYYSCMVVFVMSTPIHITNPLTNMCILHTHIYIYIYIYIWALCSWLFMLPHWWHPDHWSLFFFLSLSPSPVFSIASKQQQPRKWWIIVSKIYLSISLSDILFLSLTHWISVCSCRCCRQFGFVYVCLSVSSTRTTTTTIFSSAYVCECRYNQCVCVCVCVDQPVSHS